jgi:uncharacterized membrane protein
VTARRLTAVRLGLAALLAGSAGVHFVAPDGYRRIVPRFLGHEAELVALSGAAEVVCAALLLLPRTRRLGGWLSAALLVAVFPANLQMAIDGGAAGAPFPLNTALGAWLRLPLQVPLVMAALAIARHSEPLPL